MSFMESCGRTISIPQRLSFNILMKTFVDFYSILSNAFTHSANEHLFSFE